MFAAVAEAHSLEEMTGGKYVDNLNSHPLPKLFTYLYSCPSKSIAQVGPSTLILHGTDMLLNITHILIFFQVKLNLSRPGRTELKQTDMCTILGNIETRNKLFEEFSDLYEMRNSYTS